MKLIQTASAVILSILLTSVPTFAQTFSSCNPLTQGGCPADAALGKSISVDFTKGSVDSFTASGNPTYDSNGVSFTVARSGDSPTLISKFYIMFGKVSITMKVAPGAGIVSTLVLQSDDLDEIDMEWLGADDSEVQTNYFGKGNTATYNRGAFNPAPGNQENFVTYSVEYTAQQVVWSVGGQTVRVLTPATAEANQYPQTPMQIKFGAWSGGDPSNAPGTIGWARGPTDYSKGPFTMVVQSIDVSDYSTGTSYSYSGTSGNWQDINAAGGSIGTNSGGSNSAVASEPSATSASPSIPVGGFGSGRDSTATQTGYPWVAATTLQTAAPATSAAGIPPGWTVSSSGKIVPANSAAQIASQLTPSTTVSQPSPSSLHAGLETVVTYDDRGFLTTMLFPAGWSTMPKSYNQQGFLITPTSIAAATAAGTSILMAAATDRDSDKDKDSAASHFFIGEKLRCFLWLAVAGGTVFQI